MDIDATPDFVSQKLNLYFNCFILDYCLTKQNARGNREHGENFSSHLFN